MEKFLQVIFVLSDTISSVLVFRAFHYNKGRFKQKISSGVLKLVECYKMQLIKSQKQHIILSEKRK